MKGDEHARMCKTRCGYKDILVLVLYPVHNSLIPTAREKNQSDDYVEPKQKKQKFEDGEYTGICNSKSSCMR